MKSRSIVVLALALHVGACASATSAGRDVAAGQSVELTAGESANVTPGSVRVKFTGVNDSRCPADVICVQAGDAMIILALSGGGADRVDTLYLRNPQKKSVEYGGYRFEAMDVQPYPRRTSEPPVKTLTLKVNGPQ